MLKLTPATKDYLWGGNKLRELYGKQSEAERLSESWEVSVHPDGLSTCGNQSLADYIAAHSDCVDKEGSPFPVLIKFIDAAQNLSVQVHPNDAFARKEEGDNGKTEMWYIVQADEGAGIYCGFCRDTSKEEFLAKVQDGTVEELLNFIPVKKGDCFLIEAGTVHAIGAGCVICEVQQSSNVTYRVYDYNRRGADGKLRPLHVEKATQVINYRKFANRTNSGEEKKVAGGVMRTLTDCRYFRCRKLSLNGTYLENNSQSFTAVNVLEGSGSLCGKEFHAGDSFFIPCGEKIQFSGRAEIMLTTNSTLRYYAGVDLGGTFIKCGIVDSEGRLLIKDQVATSGKYEEVARDMANLAVRLSKEAGVPLTAIGIGAPGMIDGAKGVVIYNNNLNWVKAPVTKDVSAIAGVPAYVTNDANAAALGEYTCGAGKAYNSMILITLGTGVGSGIVFDGKIFDGNKGAGAELGHTVIKIGGAKCTCGRKGCLEAYASTTALIRQTKEQMLKNKESKLWELCEGDLEKVNGKVFFAAVHAGDECANKVLKRYLDYLAAGLVNFANAFRPEVILLGGGISAQGEVLTAPLQRKMARQIYAGMKYVPVKIATATLQNDAGIYGAASLAQSKTEEK